MPSPPSGLDVADPASRGADARLRAEIVALLRGGNAHVTTEAAIDGLPPDRVNDRPDGRPHSLWDLVYHLWFTQHDILVFCLNPDYAERAWPDDYWPTAEATLASWADTTQALRSDRDRLIGLAETGDLTAELGHAPGYTLLRELLLAADHTAYHVGQIVSLRRRLGLWPPSA